ncbi:MAG: hydroxyacid dehydrogenase [Pseudomonadota bacterium]
MPDIVVSEFMDADAVDWLSARSDLRYDPALVDDRPALVEAVSSCRALIVRNRTQVRDDLVAALASAMVVGRLGVGLDNIDVEACETRGIEVVPATGANAIGVAEYVVGALMVLLRGAYGATGSVLAGDWPRSDLIGRELNGKLLGLVGFGGIARLVAVRARALGMPIQAFDPNIEKGDPVWREYGVAPVDWDALVGRSDAISLHVPLVTATRHLFDAQTLAAMKQGAVIVNTARGGVIDDVALADALRRRHLGGAALDVFETEPVPADNVFSDVPNLLATPHIAGVTEESNARVSWMIAREVASRLGLRP